MKKHLILILCLALAGSMLTACGDNPDTAQTTGTTAAVTTAVTTTAAASSDTTTGSEQGTVGGIVVTDQTTASSAASTTAASASAAASTETAASSAAAVSSVSAVTAAKPSDSDLAAAKTAAEAFLKAANEKDKDTFVKYSNMDIMLETLRISAKMSASNGKEVTEEELQKTIDQSLESAYASYAVPGGTIGDGVFPEKFINSYNQEAAENGNVLNINEEAVKENPELAELYKQITAPIEKLYIFPVKGGTEASELYVRQVGSDWKVDVLSSQMLRYVAKSKLSSANAAAKTVYKTIATALTEMDSENMDIIGLKGTHTFKGSDFNVQDSSALKGMDKMKALTAKYYTDVTKLEEITVRINKNGMPDAVAVRMSGTIYDVTVDDEIPVFGAYPDMVRVENNNSVTGTKALVDSMKLDQ